MASSFSFIVTTMTLLFPTNPLTLVGRAALALSEMIGQCASDNDLLIPCKSLSGSHPPRPQGFAQGSQSLALRTVLQTIMGHCECHKIIVLKCLWTDSDSKHSCNIYIACSVLFFHELYPFSALSLFS